MRGKLIWFPFVLSQDNLPARGVLCASLPTLSWSLRDGRGAVLVGALYGGEGVLYGAPLYGEGPVRSPTVLREGLRPPCGAPPHGVPCMKMKLYCLVWGGTHVEPTVW